MAVSRMKIIGAVIGVVALGSLVGWNVTKDSMSRIAVVTQKVNRADLVSIVSASGEVKPRKYVDVSANVPGRIVKLNVKEGDKVKTGQVLCQIETTRYEADARQAEEGVQAQKHDLEHALADLENSRLNAERNQLMWKDRLVSDQTRDQAVADYKMKQADVESSKRKIAQLEAALVSSRDDLNKTTVYATIDGVVTSLDKQEGETVIGAQSFQPTVIMTVADLSVMQVEILVDETDIRNVQVGQHADIRVDALEGTKIVGEVTEIGSSAIPRNTSTGASTTTSSTSSNTNNGNQAKDFKVTVTIKDPSPALRPSMNATADIVTATRNAVLAIPIQAVVVRQLDKEGKVIDPKQPEEGAPGAQTQPRAKGEEKDGTFVVDAKNVVHFRPVKTGIVGETDIEILDGLKEGDMIVTGSYKTLRTLKDDARVKNEAKKA
jgi:HlyD family secretion protein